MDEFSSVRISKEYHEKLKKEHEKSKIPMIHIMHQAIDDYIKKQEKKS